LLRTGELPFSGALSDEHDAVGAALGRLVGVDVGAALGIEDGAVLGAAVGTDVLGAAVGTAEGNVGDTVGGVVGEDVSHVGTASEDQPTEPTPATLHVRVVATLIANPTKQ
jgi:hypothetical protein